MVVMKKNIDIGKFWNKVRKYATAAGQKLIYSALLMFYAFREDDTPGWAKSAILGSIAYFVAPLDSIPDLTPFLGFTDDLGVLTVGLMTVAAYINEDVKRQARIQMNRLFGTIEGKTLREVDEKL